jgi:Ca2+-binding EF-hand superfamily protein
VLSAPKLKELQLRLKGAMYGSDPRKWLARYDKDKGGSLDAGEFQKIVRGHMRVGRKDLSDDDLQAFVHTLDVDGGGDVSLKEILSFLKPDPRKAQQANDAACAIQGLVRKNQAREKVKERRARSGAT